LRAQAARLFAAGLSRAAVARRLGLSRATATRWHRRLVQGGEEALVRGRRLGPPGKLQEVDREKLASLLSRSPREAGLALDAWSLASIALLIRRTTGVTFHTRHVGRWLRQAGWTIPPVGRHRERAFRPVTFADPDGATLYLRAGASARPEGPER
jgi:transposase